MNSPVESSFWILVSVCYRDEAIFSCRTPAFLNLSDAMLNSKQERWCERDQDIILPKLPTLPQNVVFHHEISRCCVFLDGVENGPQRHRKWHERRAGSKLYRSLVLLNYRPYGWRDQLVRRVQ